MTTAIQVTERETALDARTTAKLAESLVVRGDVSGLDPADKARYYLQLCESLGLNPATHPIQFLRLNGKEIAYVTRGATDQLAAHHRLNRRIIEGPKVIDLAGTKCVYAVCEATHPNGRVETAVATVPLTDPLNALMKAETKSKRRATLSILGLGMLDECELDTMPAHERIGAPLTALTNDRTEDPEPEHPAVTALHLDLDELRRSGTVWQAAEIWLRHRDAIAAIGDTDAQHAAQGACVDSVFANGEPRTVSSAEWRDVLHVLEACPSHEALRVLVSDLTSPECTSLDDVAAIWTLHKADVAKLAEDTRKLAWTAAVRRAGEYVTPPTKPADALRKALAPKPTPPTGTDGERATPAGEDAAAEGFERHQAQNDDSPVAREEAAWREHLARHHHPDAVANSYAKNYATCGLPQHRAEEIAVERIRAIDPVLTEQNARNCLRGAVARRARKAA